MPAVRSSLYHDRRHVCIQRAGDTSTLTKLFALSTAVNVILDPIMIFGYAGFQPLGLPEPRLPRTFPRPCFVVAIRTLMSPNEPSVFIFPICPFQWESVKKVLRIGFPASLTQVIFPIGLAALTLITAKGFAEAGAVAFSLGLRIEFFAYLPAVGYGFGAMAMIGQNIGAGNIDRARTALREALKYSFLMAGGLGILAALFSSPIIRAFTEDPSVMAYTRLYLWSVALTYGFLAALMVEASAFQAIGRSWPGFWVFLLRVFVLAIPLAYVSTQVFHFSIIAVWAAIMVANIGSSVTGYFWIRRAMATLDLNKAPVNT